MKIRIDYPPLKTVSTFSYHVCAWYMSSVLPTDIKRWLCYDGSRQHVDDERHWSREIRVGFANRSRFIEKTDGTLLCWKHKSQLRSGLISYLLSQIAKYKDILEHARSFSTLNENSDYLPLSEKKPNMREKLLLCTLNYINLHRCHSVQSSPPHFSVLLTSNCPHSADSPCFCSLGTF